MFLPQPASCMRLGAIILAGLLLTAGCLGATSTDASDDNLGTARDAASEFIDEPALVEMWGIEPPREARDNDTTVITHLDDDQGDGEAPGWGYRFIGPETEGIVLVAAEVGVIAEVYEDRDDDELDPPIRNASVESPEVAEILNDHPEWPSMQENTTVFWHLEHDAEEDRPIWTVEAGDGAELFFDERTRATVDASTGEVLEIERIEDGFEGGPATEGGCSRETSSGQVTPTDDLSVETDLGGTGEVTVETEATGLGPLNVTLTGPNGTVWSTTYDVQGSASEEKTAEEVPPGTYEATASTEDGAFDVDLEIVAQWGFSTCPDIDVGPTGGGPTATWLTRYAPYNR